jgi:hypothetical protein
MESMKKLMLVLGLVMLCACATGDQGTDTAVTTGGTGAGVDDTVEDTGTTGTGTTGTGATGTMGTGGTAGTSAAAGGGPGGPCANVRCASCPTGQTPALRPPNCCACMPVDSSVTDCSTVRCAACPTGQRPALTPPDCCRCVAG